jgi:hypothetical protein
MTTIANTEIELFGRKVRIDESGFFSPDDLGIEGSFKAFVPRSLVKGRRVNMAQMLEAVRDLFQQGKTGSEIAAILDKDSDTIGRYKKIIIAFGALDESAIVQKREQEGEFRNEKTALMLARFEGVEKWQARLMSKPKASKKKIKSFAASLNRVCQILKMSPVAILQKTYTGDEQLYAIDELMAQVRKEVKSESSFYSIRMALRSWIQYNQIGIPRGSLCPPNLSGKVVDSHGKAAHVRLDKDELKQANAILENPKSKLPHKERQTDTAVFFKFGTETGSRQLAIITAKIQDVQSWGGWNSKEQLFKTIERKLYHVGEHEKTKRIFCPELVRIINARQAAGEKCLIGKPNEYVNYSTMEQPSTDDVKQNKAQIRALKEIDDNLRAVYQQVGGNAADPYFAKKPSHSIRHIACQYWLRKSDFDYGFTAEIVGSMTIDELRKSYGGMPRDIFEAKYDKYINSGE